MISRTIYAKWGHFVFAGQVAYDLRFAAGRQLFLTSRI
jgi:hypothetical protein